MLASTGPIGGPTAAVGLRDELAAVNWIHSSGWNDDPHDIRSNIAVVAPGVGFAPGEGQQSFDKVVLTRLAS
jgi:hypothetical protein